MRQPDARWRAGGVRWQATIVAGLVVGLSLVVGGALLVVLLHSTVTGNLESSLTALVTQDTETLQSKGLSALAASETDRGADSILVQVIDSSGVVRYTSEPARTAAQTELRPAPGQTLVAGRTLVPAPGDQADLLQVAQGATVDGQPVVVAAMASQEPLESAVKTTAVLLAAGIPLMVLLTGMLTWWRVGRALRSVESIRVRVEQIEGGGLSQRVPVPPSHDEIADLATTMNRMLSRLELSDTTQRQFVADASHELRSPLATLTASLDVAEQNPSEATWRDLSPVLRMETGRMGRLVEDLLLLSKVDNRALLLQQRDVDLDDVAEQECRRLRQMTGLGVTLQAEPVKVMGDADHLARLLRNLLENAAAAARTQVRCSVRRHGRQAVLVVEDDGPGIPPRNREVIFNRFVRLDESRSRESGGSGLGLAIVQEVAEAHDGSVDVSESRWGGAAFTVTLPAVS